MGRLQAVALVEDPGLIERQQTEFAQLDAVRTLAVRVAAVQDDAAGGVDHGAHAAVDGAGELDLNEAQCLTRSASSLRWVWVKGMAVECGYFRW